MAANKDAQHAFLETLHSFNQKSKHGFSTWQIRGHQEYKVFHCFSTLMPCTNKLDSSEVDKKSQLEELAQKASWIVLGTLASLI